MYDLIFYPSEEKPLLNDFFKILIKENDSMGYQEVERFLNALRKYGLKINNKFSPEAIKYLKAGLYELRPGNYRIFFTIKKSENSFYILHGFKKKSNKTPQKELIKARNYVKEIKMK